MASIICKTTSVSDKATQLRTYIKQDRATLTALDKTLNSLGYTWQGAASKSFLQKYTMQKTEIRAFLKTLEEFTTLMEQTADVFEDTDEQMRRKVNAV